MRTAVAQIHCNDRHRPEVAQLWNADSRRSDTLHLPQVLLWVELAAS